jgi:recombination protein RecA
MATAREVGKHTRKLTNTRALREYKENLHLSTIQRELLIGTILGDGCLITSRSGESARLQVRHNRKHKEYVLWKYSFFMKWVRNHPKEDFHNNSFFFRTLSHPDFMKIKQLFYIKNKRVIPNTISDIFISPLSLAVWLMDDGNGFKNHKAFRVSSYGFGLHGNILLQHCLQKNFFLETNLSRDSKGCRLYFPKRSTSHLYELIHNYIVPCMQYKFATLTP